MEQTKKLHRFFDDKNTEKHSIYTLIFTPINDLFKTVESI